MTKNEYTYSIGNNTVYCMTYYAGKTIKGVAKCSPEDTFDVEVGKKLAKARCNVKLAKKRLEVKQRRKNFADAELALAKVHANNASRYYREAIERTLDAIDALNEIENSLS